MKQLLYLSNWFFKAKFLGKKSPLQTVIFISDKCNLTCKHCSVYKQTNPNIKKFDAIRQELEYSYKLGSRFVDFEGGEPMIWRDNGKDINDLCRFAKEIGFFSTTVTTNAQLPFKNLVADSVWVSLDGIGQFHDRIRGGGAFERLVKHVGECNHTDLNFNMVVNSLNYKNVEDTVLFAHNNPKIKKISINFHTPYKGTEYLFLDWDLRCKVIDDIIGIKRSGYAIMNSYSGLSYMKNLDFKKECWVTNFILSDSRRLAQCQGEELGMCDKCGLCMSGEMKSVFDLRIDTIISGLRLRVKQLL